MLRQRKQDAAQARARGVEARRAMRAAQGGAGRGAAVWRRSERARAERARMEAAGQAASGGEGEEGSSSDEEGSEREEEVSDGGEGAELPESYFEVAELLRTRGVGNEMQVLVRWTEAGLPILGSR